MAVPAALLIGGSSQASPVLTVGQAQTRLAALQSQEDTATEAYDAGVIASDQASAQARTAGQAVTVQSAKLLLLQQGIAAFAAASYTDGALNPVDSLLAGGNPEQLLARAAGVNEVARNNAATLQKITAQREVLAAAQELSQQQASVAKTALATLTAAKDQVSGVLAQEQGVLGHLQAGQRTALLAADATARAAAAKQVPAASAGRRGMIRTGLSVPAASGAAKVALAAAYAELGRPYSYGAAGPGAFDCSGLVMWAYARAGISLPHSAAAQYGYGTHVSRSALQPGDLVFYGYGGISHVGIYVGGGEMIDANHTGGWVGVRPLYNDLVGATRL